MKKATSDSRVKRLTRDQSKGKSIIINAAHWKKKTKVETGNAVKTNQLILSLKTTRYVVRKAILF